ncbi:Uncharacterized protein FWK35_00003511 [Aphis craccivora]|uniref:Uncharacterized protein n=1 Tax=Aphis craccivora TaxID=307492 RepID=A0A6G0Z967_APHCR|nr:Uncharacterized protein FWK35_00003511 [Aphis craccivora]
MEVMHKRFHSVVDLKPKKKVLFAHISYNADKSRVPDSFRQLTLDLGNMNFYNLPSSEKEAVNFLQEYSVAKCTDMSNNNYEQELNLNENTIIDWNNYLCEVCAMAIDNKPHGKIVGPGKFW